MNSRYAVITGASQGIGEHLARVLASKNYSLILASRNLEKLSLLAEELSARHGIKAYAIDCDLSNESGIQKLIQFCSAYLTEIEVLVNNAGFGDLGEFSEQKWEVFQQMLGLNVVGLTELTHFFSGHFKKNKKGYILNVASTAAFQPDPYFSVYGATKAYVLSLSEALREELAPHNVQVSVLCPGPTNTPFHHRAGTHQSPFVSQFMSPVEEVAREGIKGLFEKRTVIVPGLLNRFLISTLRLAPRAAVAKLASWMLRPRSSKF
jgi:short-subunit dehydrogenase